LTDFFLDEREISEFPYIIYQIPYHILNAKPGDNDLLAEVQGIESLPEPIFGKSVTYSLELGVVHWLQVGSDFSCKPIE